MCRFTHRSHQPDIAEKWVPYPVYMEQSDALTRSDIAILEVLVANPGRILSRASLLRSAGLETLSERRCDASLVILRRVLGAESIITVRRRGWMLSENALVAAIALLTAVADKL